MKLKVIRTCARKSFTTHKLTSSPVHQLTISPSHHLTNYRQSPIAGTFALASGRVKPSSGMTKRGSGREVFFFLRLPGPGNESVIILAGELRSACTGARSNGRRKVFMLVAHYFDLNDHQPFRVSPATNKLRAAPGFHPGKTTLHLNLSVNIQYKIWKCKRIMHLQYPNKKITLRGDFLIYDLRITPACRQAGYTI